ncbi:MAG: hypothetical protein EBX50_17205, partial [Chitinophagia bacterium]|nr:hypothetical protein [Chitinophagia bacterium]
ASFFSSQHGFQKNAAEILEKLIYEVREKNLIQPLLHEPEETVTALAISYARDNSIELDPDFSIEKVDGLKQNIENSFKPFSGVLAFLKSLYEADVPFNIYTNTGPEDTAKRLIKMGVPPEYITKIWSRVPIDKPFIVEQWHDAATEAFASKISPYTQPKPNAEPFIDAQRRGVAADNTLFIGEGLADLGCVIDDSTILNQFSKFHARFAFQLAGAEATEFNAGMNEKLRAGHPIGVSHFNRCYPQALEHAGVAPLRDGFNTLNDLLANGSIIPCLNGPT